MGEISHQALIDVLLYQAAILRKGDENKQTAGRYFCAVCHEYFDD